MKRLPVVLAIGALAGALLLGAASRPASAQAVLSADRAGVLASPDGRLEIGRGKDYVPSDVAADELFDELKNSMRKRRDFAWEIVEQLLQPQKITLLDGVTEVDVPLWQTWYEGRPSRASANQELFALFELYFKNLKPVLDADPNADLKPVIDATIAQFSTKDMSSSLTSANLSSVLHQHADTADAGGLVGQGTTMFSPSFIEHAMQEARGVHECEFTVANANDDPPSSDQFSHCMKEFPRSAVMIKTSWRKLADGIPDHTSDAAAMTALIDEGTWPSFDPPPPPRPPSHPTKTAPLVNPDRTVIYTNITEEGEEWALTGIHFVTKDVREWVWVSLWWDPNASDDFGADRPASIGNFNNGVWKNYNMCVNSAFDEGDATPWSTYSGAQASLGDSIKAVYDAIENHIQNGAQAAVGPPPRFPTLSGALGPWAAPNNVPTSWCSNPNIETHTANGRTNCIGCHQIAFTKNEDRSVVQGSEVEASFRHAMRGDYPQFGRSRIRRNFPAEFSWSFDIEFRPAIRLGMGQAGFSWPTN